MQGMMAGKKIYQVIEYESKKSGAKPPDIQYNFAAVILLIYDL